MRKYKIKFVVQENGEENMAAEYEVSVQQYMKILGQVKKLKGVR